MEHPIRHSHNEPIYVTKDGYGDMILMSMDYYKAKRKRWEMYADLEISEEQIAQGKTSDAKKALQSVRAKYGLYSETAPLQE